MRIYSHSDTGNGELFNDLFGNDIRFNPKTERWLQWQEGLYWKPLNEVEVYNLAVKIARHRRFEIAPNLSGNASTKEMAFAVKSENVNQIDATLRAARSISPIGNPNIRWDSQLNLLACSNGVVNLSTGVLRSGQRNDFISRGISLPYIENAKAPLWDRFVSDIMCGNQENIDFLRRAIGYTITGFTTSQVFFLLYGNGSNGKSVLLDTLNVLLEGFSHTVRFGAFEENNRSDERKDLAELPGIRLVFASESGKKSALDTSVIKQITGSEPITTSRKYGHPFTFQPQFKLWLTTNNLPKVDDDSFGFWRRMIVIPFNATFEGNNRDLNMQAKLEGELPGILAWVVRGAQEWKKHGLGTPDSLLLRVQEYKESEDDLANFISEHTITKLGSKIRFADLYETYKSWLGEDGNPVSKIEFGRRMRNKLKSYKDMQGTYFADIEIKVII